MSNKNLTLRASNNSYSSIWLSCARDFARSIACVCGVLIPTLGSCREGQADAKTATNSSIYSPLAEATQPFVTTLEGGKVLYSYGRTAAAYSDKRRALEALNGDLARSNADAHFITIMARGAQLHSVGRYGPAYADATRLISALK